METHKKIIAVIWTFNPGEFEIKQVLQSIIRQVDEIIIVDNGSIYRSYKKVVKSSPFLRSKTTLIELKRNYGVRALNIGIEEAINAGADFILLLDDDTVLYEGVIKRVISCWRKLIQFFPNVGVVGLTEGYCCKNLIQVETRVFSGSIIDKRVLESGIKIREEFFLDQADFDFFHEIKRAGYEVLQFDGGIKEHKLGVKIKFGGRILRCEPLHRYYYIVRNSTVLLLERKLPLFFYIRQLIIWGFPSALVKGVKRTMRTLIMGLAHGIFKRLGYLDPKFLES